MLARLFLLLALALPALAQEKPNIVILFADDLGYGDLSSYGHPIVRTPHLDRIAAEGVRFTSFYSAPWCVPARSQLLLGRYPPRYDLGKTGVDGDGGIPASERTLAQALKSAGYRTAMVGKWHLGYRNDAHLPVGRGFDSWLGLPYSNDMIKPWVRTETPLWLYDGTKKTERMEDPEAQETLTTRYAERAVELIRKSGDDPFFLYVAFSMPHLPIHTAERFQGRSRAGLFGDVIETVDWAAGEVLNALQETGAADNTLVFFTSDNGPWMSLPDRMIAGGVERWHAGTSGLLRGWKHTVYEGGVRVPAVLRWPGAVEPGQVTPEMASTLDIHATALAAAGVEEPEHELDGHDLRPWLSGEAAESPRKEFAYFHQQKLKAVRMGPWKLKVDTGEPELYHLELDPSELYNRAESEPGVVARLRTRMAEIAAEVGR